MGGKYIADYDDFHIKEVPYELLVSTFPYAPLYKLIYSTYNKSNIVVPITFCKRPNCWGYKNMIYMIIFVMCIGSLSVVLDLWMLK